VKDIRERASAHGVSAHKIKRAFVIKGDENDYDFYETTSVNRGLNVGIFHDKEEAINWLTAK
jgi:hypothetical protein